MDEELMNVRKASLWYTLPVRGRPGEWRNGKLQLDPLLAEGMAEAFGCAAPGSESEGDVCASGRGDEVTVSSGLAAAGLRTGAATPGAKGPMARGRRRKKASPVTSPRASPSPAPGGAGTPSAQGKDAAGATPQPAAALVSGGDAEEEAVNDGFNGKLTGRHVNGMYLKALAKEPGWAPALTALVPGYTRDKGGRRTGRGKGRVQGGGGGGGGSVGAGGGGGEV